MITTLQSPSWLGAEVAGEATPLSAATESASAPARVKLRRFFCDLVMTSILLSCPALAPDARVLELFVKGDRPHPPIGSDMAEIGSKTVDAFLGGSRSVNGRPQQIVAGLRCRRVPSS